MKAQEEHKRVQLGNWNRLRKNVMPEIVKRSDTRKVELGAAQQFSRERRRQQKQLGLEKKDNSKGR